MSNSAHKLDSERHNAIYQDIIAARYLPKSKPQEKPLAIITGGQPGSGKSGITNQAVARFRESGYVLVDADKLRPHHPDYIQLMRSNDKLAANLTHPDCGPWANRLLRDGVDGKRNIIIDQTSRDPEALRKMAQGLHQAGYKVEMHVMAVSPKLSEQRIFQRYEDQRETNGYGRFSTKEKHDEAFAGVAKTVAVAEREALVDRLCIYDHKSNRIYDNRLDAGNWQHAPAAAQTLDTERTRPMTLQEKIDYAKGYDDLASVLARPARNATSEEIRTIADLQKKAHADLEQSGSARILAAEKILQDQIKTLPADKQAQIMGQFQEAIKNPESVSKLPAAQQAERQQAAPAIERAHGKDNGPQR